MDISNIIITLLMQDLQHDLVARLEQAMKSKSKEMRS